MAEAPTTSEAAVVVDWLVIGSGLAGLLTAIKASASGSVALVTKLQVENCNSAHAQGGIACRVAADDTFESHIDDTLRAGAGMCDKSAVEAIIRAAPARIADLEKYGVRFTRRGSGDVSPTPSPAPQDDHRAVSPVNGARAAWDEYDLGREGGHSARRILHAGDITGAEIIRALHAEALGHPNITVYTEHIAVDLISARRMGWAGPNVCVGAYVLDKAHNVVRTFVSKATFLCCGGAGKVYLYTTNPDTACGDGIAMAYRAYAEISNMEFMQFHPTCLYHPQLNEALRGEGAKLKIKAPTGEFVEFMQRYHPLGDLAPRDIVARAIDNELKRTGNLCVYLDIRHHPESFLRTRFPNIFAKLMTIGINMATDLIPVVPAAHFICGGIRTDIDGQTTVAGLYAVGECACTGLHGANRLASNSLLECCVIAHNAVQHAAAHPAPVPSLPSLTFNRSDSASAAPAAWVAHVPHWTCGNAVDSDEAVVVAHNWDEVRRFMWDYVGIFRTTRRLQRAKHRIGLLRKEIEKYYWDFKLTSDLIELRNIASVAEMIVDSALNRQESVGLHYNADFPPDPAATAATAATVPRGIKNTVLRRSQPVVAEFAISYPPSH